MCAVAKCWFRTKYLSPEVCLSVVFKAKALVRGNSLLQEQQHYWEKMVSPLGTFCRHMTSPAFFLTCHQSQKSPKGYSFRLGGYTVLRGTCVMSTVLSLCSILVWAMRVRQTEDKGSSGAQRRQFCQVCNIASLCSEGWR